mmetsp:Transcript_8141/g.17634  ORF Transcript_8141/g.17634 Transcript_8141/m.17634 type:complete len:729 (+) Transcript_8141:147-2333(+)
MGDVDADDEGVNGKSGKKGSSKSRRELPEGAVATLKAWLLSPEHFTHPYPTPQDQVMLMQKTGIDKKQLKNWFTNARRRIWKPMLKKQLEQGKIATTGAGGGGVVTIPPGPGSATVPPLTQQPPPPRAPPSGAAHSGEPYEMAPTSSGPDGSVHVMQQHYQQALQQSQPHQLYDAYGNPASVYAAHQRPPSSHPGGVSRQAQEQWQGQVQYGQQPVGAGMAQSNSIGSLPPITPSGGSTGNVSHLNKTDSHAVLMELFARDQDLVRQATEGARLKVQTASGGASVSDSRNTGPAEDSRQQQSGQGIPSQHPMMASTVPTSGGAVGKMGSAASYNSWPHFSSVSSLNNLGTMTGVKSITNMSGADLVSQGSLNKKGNLAQVKSIESMGRADSYAFLEVFFEDRGSGNGASGAVGSGSGISTEQSPVGSAGMVAQPSHPQEQKQSQHLQVQQQRGVKREREEESDDIGLSLDGPDESPSTVSNSLVLRNGKPGGNPVIPEGCVDGGNNVSAAPVPSPISDGGKERTEPNDHKGNLKRAYDDALAARGLISVRRSCEKLTDLALPAKMQRTLSQEFLRQQMNPTVAPHMAVSYGNFSSDHNTGTTALLVEHIDRDKGVDIVEGGPKESEQSAGQPPAQEGSRGESEDNEEDGRTNASSLTDHGVQGSSVEVPATTKCALCRCINVDTQLRPCGHMFHGRCLKPSLQNAVGPPKCPIDHIVMQSAVLAIPEA